MYVPVGREDREKYTLCCQDTFKTTLMERKTDMRVEP